MWHGHRKTPIVCPLVDSPSVFTNLHSVSHPVVRVFIKLNSDYYAKSCILIQWSKIHRHVQSSIAQLPTDNGRFYHVYLKIVGPLPPPDGCCFLLTCVDFFARWPLAVPIADAYSGMISKAFPHHWISATVPSTAITDGGAQFQSKLFTDFFTLLGLKRSCVRIPPFIWLISRDFTGN